LGAPTGLRQISISRYSFGWWPTKLVAVLNTIQQVGWSSAGCITGGIALNAVADGKVSTTVGIVIIAVCSLIVSFFGIKAILPFERYAWLVYLVVFLIILGQTGSSADATPGTSLEGLELSGTVLSLLAIVYGSSASWCSCASDYYVLYPPSTSRTKVFLLTTLGVSMPTAFCMICGCVVSSALNNQPDWLDAYNNNGGSGLGFLLQTALHPSGFAKFLLVLLVLSGINCNIINTYSAALSCQQFARPFARIPRVLWTVACFAAILAIALAGRNSLLSYLENFLSLLGYWCTSYFVIVATEHFLFRRGNVALNYDLEAWNDPSRLPWGLAALTSFLLGVVMWCMGMVETWFVGPVGGMIGEGGGDVANELTFAMTLVAYVPLRWLELRYVGR
jgi:NCS1 nucleoside transporter family